ncbi:beta-1,6-N-acetylglucosaminyltransferase [Xylophilus sp. GOD-11R]|uniref:beta-1,6-N-acetylglucosaminyltransferase n=1 Tax=Xylophilus sp. GOD-11R TaxID=3089814 RepID=UPI00298C7A77|nr:beta-1,6-N-acetylglucosaminyltransferase [Xylophilus sp. GOD-11R]WPB55467.1 beta-1,6-N-acetylglucosaminyltransferase [Xylophilus sp. GOD-11R]
MLLVHADPAQAKRLLRMLVNVGKCFVHVDAKSSLSEFLLDDDRIVYLQDRVDVRWGAISQVNATLELMRTALAHTEAADVSHFVLLSGSCYPAKSLAEFQAFSAANADRNFIKTIPLNTTVKLNQRMQHLWFYEDFPVDGRKFTAARFIRGVLQAGGKLARRRYPLYANWCFGSQWWALNHEALSLLASHPEEARITRFLRFSKAPDEIYFHTLLANSHLHRTMQPVTGRGVWDANNLHLIDDSLARWFHVGDLAEIIDSGCWFVRKVGSAREQGLCDKLDEMTGNAAPRRVEMNALPSLQRVAVSI